MDEVRCSKCGKLLCKAEPPYKLELKCPKCKTLQMQGKTEMIDFANMRTTVKNTNKKESVKND
jgi:phage FluMu protein Com